MLSVSRLAQLVERKTLNLVVVGSSPTVGEHFFFQEKFFFFCIAKRYVTGVGFEPTPPKRLVPETSALDRSAIQPMLWAMAK